jgi:hypothetical protein
MSFYEQTRIINDNTDKSQVELQNAQSSAYTLNNFRPNNKMSSAIDFATSQPNVNFTGGHQTGFGGYNIDENTQLMHTPVLRPKCKVSLNHRIFSTVPFLGRGVHDSDSETYLRHGDIANNKKSIYPSSEFSYAPYALTPQIQSIRNTITNPKNLIETSADKNWVRGGISTRI